VSLEMVSTKRNRVYQRTFDHDKARALHEAEPLRWTCAQGLHSGFAITACHVRASAAASCTATTKDVRATVALASEGTLPRPSENRN
jgi:hypothetical protein